METKTLNFTALAQTLTADDGIQIIASSTVNYVEAIFDLDDNWQACDSVSAVWSNSSEQYATLLDSDGACYVPQELLAKRGTVNVNLAGSVVEDDTVTYRLTSHNIPAIRIDCKAYTSGDETEEVTPSQFEQFVAQVESIAEAAEESADAAEASSASAADSATSAESSATAAATSESNASDYAAAAATSAEEAAASAEQAEQAAAQAGYMYFSISDGDLYYTKTDNVDVDFYLEDGDLYVS